LGSLKLSRKVFTLHGSNSPGYNENWIDDANMQHYLSRKTADVITKKETVAMRTILGLCCSLLVVVSAATTSRVPKAPEQVDVHFRFQEGVATLHEPVVLIFEVHNGLKQPITVTVGSLTRQFYDLTLTTPRGQVLRKDPFNGQVDVVTLGDGKIIVEPGADYKEPLVMNQWFPFESQGTYSLTSKLTSDIETADANFQAESQTAQLLINARDPTRLNKICANLEQQAEMASTAEAAQFPALELSYANDPIAVAYLDRLLSAHTLGYEKAVKGLERIGNDEAVEVLLSALNENWGDIAELGDKELGTNARPDCQPRSKRDGQEGCRTFVCGGAKLTVMEVRIKPETESRLTELASKSGRATDDLVEDALAGYLTEVAEVR
jgi:hypothetical protein